jgi:hypothetical protein
MSLADIVKAGVAIADSQTQSLQVPVTFEAWIGDDEVYSRPQYAAPVTMMALVEMKQRLIRLPNEEEILQRAMVTFLRPIAPNGAAERREPIDPRDKITLPNGYTGPIKNVEGLETTLPNSPYFVEVTLG